MPKIFPEAISEHPVFLGRQGKGVGVRGGGEGGEVCPHTPLALSWLHIHLPPGQSVFTFHCYFTVPFDCVAIDTHTNVKCVPYLAYVYLLQVRLQPTPLKEISGNNHKFVLHQLQKTILLVQQVVEALPASLQVRGLKNYPLGVGAASARSSVS